MLRKKQKIVGGLSKTTCTAFKQDSRSLQSNKQKTENEYLSKLFKTLAITKAKPNLPPILMSKKAAKYEPILNDDMFMKTVGKNMLNRCINTNRECFICKQKGLNHADHELNSHQFQTSSRFYGTENNNTFGLYGNRTSRDWNSRRNNGYNKLLSQTADITSGGAKKYSKNPFCPVRNQEYEDSQNEEDKKVDFTDSRLAIGLKIDIPRLEYHKSTIIITNEGNKNILDTVNTDKEPSNLSSLKPSIPKASTRTHISQDKQNPTTKKLDLKKIRHDIRSQMKDKASNDDDRPYLDSMQRPRPRAAHYYISELRSSLVGSPGSRPHVDLMASMHQCLKAADSIVLDSELVFVAKKEAVCAKMMTVVNVMDRYASRKEGQIERESSDGVVDVKKWVLLDLDDVLVNVEFGEGQGDHILMLQHPLGSKKRAAITFRPFLSEFLERVCEFYNILIYTSSSRSYAEKIVELIDPHRTIFKAVLCAEFCMKVYRSYVSYR